MLKSGQSVYKRYIQERLEEKFARNRPRKRRNKLNPWSGIGEPFRFAFGGAISWMGMNQNNAKGYTDHGKLFIRVGRYVVYQNLDCKEARTQNYKRRTQKRGMFCVHERLQQTLRKTKVWRRKVIYRGVLLDKKIFCW